MDDKLKDRIKLLRSNLGLTQSKFGERIGVKGNTITNYENGLRFPSEAVLFSICREFRVNYFWLTEGKGEMFSGTPQDVVDEIAEDYHLDDIDKKIIEKYLELSAEQRQIIKEYLKSIFS